MLIQAFTIAILVTSTLSTTGALSVPTSAPLQATPDFGKRCEGGDCTYGGTATTLTANTITTTVLSTTSVPCYITTYVTDSTTTTSTFYSTDIITSTVTEKGIVTVIKYQPTPVLKSSTWESVTHITQTGTTFWQETGGSAYEETVTGDTQTIGGGINGGKNYDDGNKNGGYDNGKNGYGNGSGNWNGANPGTTVQISTAAATGTAWTHAAAAAAGQGVTKVNANGQAVTTAVVGGWGATNGNVVAGNAAGVTANANGIAVNWSSGVLSKDQTSSLLIVATELSTVIVFEIVYCSS